MDETNLQPPETGTPVKTASLAVITDIEQRGIEVCYPNKKSNSALVDQKKPYVRLADSLFENVLSEEPSLIELPELKLLQALSPECTPGGASYKEEARQGLFYHTTSQDIAPSLNVVVIAQHRTIYPDFITNGNVVKGNIVEELICTTKEFLDRYEQIYHLISEEDEGELKRQLFANVFYIGFKSTGLKTLRDWMALLNQCYEPWDNYFSLASTLVTNTKDNKTNSWYKHVIVPIGVLGDHQKVIARSLNSVVRTIVKCNDDYWTSYRESRGPTEQNLAPNIDEAPGEAGEI